MIYPCHSRPEREWCDHSGPGGFMGHTCLKPPNLAYLPLVAEEAGEVIQAAMKLIRFGRNDRYPRGEHEGRTTVEALAFEIGDFLEVIDRLGLPWELINEGREIKRIKLELYGPENWRPGIEKEVEDSEEGEYLVESLKRQAEERKP